MATSVWLNFRGCSHSLMFKPVDLLATQVAPTAANIFLAEQPWLLHPNTSRFVTSPCPGYANRPIRATDGKRTCTSQDSQPCRLFLDRFLPIFRLMFVFSIGLLVSPNELCIHLLSLSRKAFLFHYNPGKILRKKDTGARKPGMDGMGESKLFGSSSNLPFPIKLILGLLSCQILDTK